MRWTTGVAVALAGAVAVGAGACDEPTDCELASRVDEPELVVGWGEDAFDRPLVEGESVVPVWGGQGGRHLWLAVKTFGFAPGVRKGLFMADQDVPVFIARLVGVDDGEVYVEQGWNYDAMDGDAAEATIALGTFIVSGIEAAALVQPLTLEVEGTDSCGNVLVGSVDITIDGMESYSSY